MNRASFSRETADVRRQAMIDATAACLAEKGAAGASVRAICMRAGVSPGLLRHYFEGVDALIAETYRATTDRMARAVAAAVAQAGEDKRARLIAYITANFHPPIADPGVLATWIAFWSLIRSDPAIASIHKESYAAFRAELEILLADCGMPPAQTGPIAIALTALVDGLWLELSLDASTLSGQQASAIAIRWVDTLLKHPNFD
ncbi:transcriptional regulator BetI [Rhizorhapis suberifaciens]|uniref:AcrR family transcriptional regulator n=1 Tax=Rhizorhapis suberifaciens TaxID=13656 RepID=A0A840HSX8_9SPHN|nr:transcriptional regulator BetI [Rhizorhapis suberifaciens]MBB4640668.1 AcrR family transcriptional regulator [Rhizorhapis suberifaciens]